MPIVAWYMLSKESYMKRVMSEVLPTVVTFVSLPLEEPRFPRVRNGVLSHTALFAQEDQSVAIVSMNAPASIRRAKDLQSLT